MLAGWVGWWNVWDLDARGSKVLRTKRLPIDILEKGVILNFLNASRDISISHGDVLLRQTFDQALCIWVEALGETDPILCNHLEHLHRIVVHEGWPPV